MNQNKVDVLVVGAGPAGFSVAAECRFHGIESVLVIEKGKTHNQTVYQYYPEDKRVDANYKGQEAICAGVLCFRDTTKANFLAIVDQMLQEHQFPIVFETMVDSIRKVSKDHFVVSTTDGKTFESKFVVIAIGRMGKPNRPEYFNDIPANARKQVHFDIKNVNAVGKEVLVVGGGNSAIEFALSLAQKGNVTVSYRQDKFARLNPMNLTLLEQEEKAGKIKIHRSSNIEKVTEKDGKPHVHFKENGEKTFDSLVYGIGGSSPVAFLQSAGIDTDEKGNPKLNARLETSVPGLFVAGELSVPPGKGSIIVSFNSGKKVVEAITNDLGISRKAEQVSLTGGR